MKKVCRWQDITEPHGLGSLRTYRIQGTICVAVKHKLYKTPNAAYHIGSDIHKMHVKEMACFIGIHGISRRNKNMNDITYNKHPKHQ